MGKILPLHSPSQNRDKLFYMGRNKQPVPYNRRNLFHVIAMWRHVRH
jgi:hypothetical protein